jgi:hypothetical protein
MSEWRYDAAQDHPMVARRIPVVRTTYPRWQYELCVCVADPEQPVENRLWDGKEPTAEEWDLIEAAIGYRMTYYRAGWAARMREPHPFDIDGTTNTVILMKRGDGDWCYRRDSFTMGPPMYPPSAGERLDLRGLLDHVFGVGDRPYEPWEVWKAAHADLWPAPGRADQGAAR